MSGHDLAEHRRGAVGGRPRAAGITERPPLLAALAAAGVAGPIVFTVAFVVQGLLRSGEYSAVAETVSALEAGPNGWIQQVNFVVFGLLMIAYAIGLHLGVRPSRAGTVGPAIMVWTGVGAVLAAVFPLREDPAGLTYDPTGLHVVNAMLFFASIGVGLIVLSRRLARDPQWRSLASYTLATGIAVVILFVGLPVLVVPDHAPLHPWAGLYQRAVLAVWFPCTILLALRLRRVARAAAVPHQPPTGRQS